MQELYKTLTMDLNNYEIKIVEGELWNLLFINNDINIAFKLGMNVNKYRRYVRKKFNGKIYTRLFIDSRVCYLYVDNQECAEKWKEWVESQLIIRRLINK